MGIKTAILAMAMGLGGLSASAGPAWSSLPGGDDLQVSLDPPSLAVVVCLEADPFFDPAEAFPHERVILVVNGCPNGQVVCCPACNACCDPEAGDFCCGSCFPSYCGEPGTCPCDNFRPGRPGEPTPR